MSWEENWKKIGLMELKGEPYIWKFYQLLIGEYDFRGKKVLEFGCGTGINNIIMAKLGAKVTFFDYSQEALNIAKKRMEGCGLEGDYVLGDIFDSKLKGYDFVHSEGLVEHFLGEKRQRILEIHKNSVKPGGKVVIMVPNAKCPPYRIGKWFAEKMGTWIYHNEHPYTKKEFIKRVEKAGIKIDNVMGGESIFSWGWLFSGFFLNSRNIIRLGTSKPANPSLVKLNYNNFYSNRWGRVLGISGTRI